MAATARAKKAPAAPRKPNLRLHEEVDLDTRMRQLDAADQSQRAVQAEYEAKYAEIIAPLAEQIEALERKFQKRLGAAQDRVEALQEVIRGEVIEQEKTAKGERVQAIYYKPRVTWNTEGLQGYALHDERILSFRRIGAAGVAFRARKTPDSQ